MHSHWFKLGLVDQFIDGLIANKEKRIELLFGTKTIFIKRETLPAMFEKWIQHMAEHQQLTAH